MKVLEAMFIAIILFPIILGIVGFVLIIKGIIRWRKQKKKVEGISMIVCGFLCFSILITVFIYEIAVKVCVYNSLEQQVMSGELEDVERVLKKGVSPESISHRNTESNTLADYGEYTLLFELSEGKDVSEAMEKMQLLIDYGADINRTACDDGTRYCSCIYCPNWHLNRTEGKMHGGPSSSKNQHFCKAYKKKYAYADRCGYTPLMLACKSGNYDAVNLLLENGADVNATDYCGDTALMYAVNFDNHSESKDEQIKIAKLLLQYGADKDIEGAYSGTALDAACDAEWQEMIELLSE